MQLQCASDDTDGWFGGVGSECQPSRARSAGVRARGPSPVSTADGRAQSNASRTSHGRDDPTPATERLMAIDGHVGHPFHLKTLEGRRHVVLGHVIWGEFFRESVEHVLRQLIRKVLRHVAAVVGVGAGLAALNGDGAVRIRARHVGGEVQIEELIPERGTIGCAAKGAGTDGKDLAGACPI